MQYQYCGLKTCFHRLSFLETKGTGRIEELYSLYTILLKESQIEEIRSSNRVLPDWVYLKENLKAFLLESEISKYPGRVGDMLRRTPTLENMKLQQIKAAIVYLCEPIVDVRLFTNTNTFSIFWQR